MKLRDLKHLLLTLSQEESVFMRQLFVSPGLKWHNNCSQYKFLSHFSCWLKLKIMQYFLLKSLQFNTTGCTGDNDKNIDILHLSCLCNCLRMYQHDQNVIVQECYLIFSISVESLFVVFEFFVTYFFFFRRGKFAVVKKCIHNETGEEVAAKFIRKRRKGKSCREEILREVVMLELGLEHPRLVDLKEVFETPNELVLITE